MHAIKNKTKQTKKNKKKTAATILVARWSPLKKNSFFKIITNTKFDVFLCIDVCPCYHYLTNYMAHETSQTPKTGNAASKRLPTPGLVLELLGSFKDEVVARHGDKYVWHSTLPLDLNGRVWKFREEIGFYQEEWKKLENR